MTDEGINISKGKLVLLLCPLNMQATHAERDSDELVQAHGGEDGEAPGLCLAMGRCPVGGLQHLLERGPAA